ncbi:MAG: ATP-dependent DNA ligase [Candidatus Dormiibacterota bacterium]
MSETRSMQLATLVACSEAVASTRSRKEKVVLMATLLRQVETAEVRVAVSYLAGEPRQKRLGITWSELGQSWESADHATLTLTDVDARFGEIEGITGTGSARQRRDKLGGLLVQATTAEQHFLKRLVSGELRQGALEGVVTEAVSEAAAVSLASLRRAAMLAGDWVEASAVAIDEGELGLARFRLHVGTPLLPMLAKSESSLDAALERAAPAAVEWKLDGVRVQVHRAGDWVGAFTRTLEPIAERIPEVVDAVRHLPGDHFILDGEVIALRADGRPRPFQETAARVAYRGDPQPLRATAPLTPFFFDILHLEGEDLIDLPTRDRIRIGAKLLPKGLTVPRLLDATRDTASEFMRDTLARGHEGVMVKTLDAPYQAGRRGDGWVKVKPRHTLDLVVLAAEWGHGRRQGWLSNLHLGARDQTGGFVMLGKTFKGLTDEMLRWQTQALLELEVARQGITVTVLPRLVVEVAFDGVQTSPRYPGGMALRFARVLRYRNDKSWEDADTVETVRALRDG